MLLARGGQHAGEGNVRERRLAEAAGVPLLREAFADRAYLADGSLAPRRLPGAVHQQAERILEQALAHRPWRAFCRTRWQSAAP